MNQEDMPEDFVLYLHAIETVCHYVKATKFQGQETVEDILTQGLGMPTKTANEFICCVAYSYQKGLSEAWQKQQSTTQEKLDTTSCRQKLLSRLQMFLLSGLRNMAAGIGRAVSSTEESLGPSCDTPGPGGEEKLSMQRMGSITWHPSRSVH